MNDKSIIKSYRYVVLARTTLAEAVEAQQAAERIAIEAREQFTDLVAKSGYPMVRAKEFTSLIGDSLECEIARAHSAEQFAEHSLARARKERQAVEQRLADAVASCRTLAAEFGRRRVAEIRGEILADASLRARLLEAYGAESLSLAGELGSTGWIRPDEFMTDMFAGAFTPEDLNAAAAAAVRRHLGATQ